MPKIKGLMNFNGNNYTQEDVNADDGSYSLFPYNWIERLWDWWHPPEKPIHLRRGQPDIHADESKTTFSKAENNKLKKTINDYESKLAEQSQTITSLEEYIHRLNKTIKETNSIKKGQAKKISALMQQLDQLSRERTRHETIRDQLTSEISKSKKTNEKIKTHKQNIEQTIQTYANKINTLESEIKRLRADNNTLKDNIKNATQELEQAHQQKDNLMRELQTLNIKNDASKKEVRIAAEEKKNEEDIDPIHNQSEVVSADEQLVIATRSLKEQKQKHDQLLQKHDRLLQAHNKLKGRYAQLRNQFTQQRKNLKNVEIQSNVSESGSQPYCPYLAHLSFLNGSNPTSFDYQQPNLGPPLSSPPPLQLPPPLPLQLPPPPPLPLQLSFPPYSPEPYSQANMTGFMPNSQVRLPQGQQPIQYGANSYTFYRPPSAPPEQKQPIQSKAPICKTT